MKIVKCDRCGKDVGNGGFVINLPFIEKGYTVSCGRVLKMEQCTCVNLYENDLCKKCMEELVDWMNEVIKR